MGESKIEKKQWVHLNGKLVPKEEACISIYDHGFLYGDGAFEGIRVYNRNVFRLQDHLTRLYRSSLALNIQLPVDKECMQEQVLSTLAANGHATGYIRISISRGVSLGLDPHNMNEPATVSISTEQLRLYPEELYVRGLDVVTASTRVPPAVCVDPQIKSLGRYVNNIQAKMEANRVGAGEALLLNMEGNVAEATGDNIFLLREGQLITPPTSQGALPGITRATVIDIARELGLPFHEAVITLYDVCTSDEAFLTGTAAEVIPMVSCDGRRIGEGTPGVTTKRIMAAFHERTGREGAAWTEA